MMSPSGTFSSLTTLPGTNATGGGMAFDSSGNLYVADSYNNQIDKIAPGGSASVLLNLTSAGFSAAGPNGLVFSGGNLYVAGYYDNKVLKITLGATPSVTTFATLPAGSAPTYLAVDGSGNIYASDSNSGNISEISANGSSVTTFVSLGSSAGPNGLAFDSSGNLYVAVASSQEIDKFSSTGASLGTFGANPFPGDGAFSDLVFDPNGNLYGSIPGIDDIVEFPPSGASSTNYFNQYPAFVGSLAFAPTPEPDSAALLVLGAGALLGCRRRRWTGKL